MEGGNPFRICATSSVQLDGATHRRTMVAKEDASLLPTLSVKEGKVKGDSGRFPIWRAFVLVHMALVFCWLTFLTLRTAQPEPGQCTLTPEMIRQLMVDQEVREIQIVQSSQNSNAQIRGRRQLGSGERMMEGDIVVSQRELPGSAGFVSDQKPI